MPNPVLNDKAFKDATKAGYASGAWGPPEGRSTAIPGTPVTDGPISEWNPRVMTVQGTVTATGVLFVLLLASAAFGWSQVDVVGEAVSFPTWTIFSMIAGFLCVVALHFKPQLAKILGPLYALLIGAAVGAISAAYNAQWNGIVLQAVGATLGVFLVMLFLYRTNIIKVTDRMRRIVIGATAGVAIFYLVAFLINIFGGNVSFLNANDGSLLGIAISIGVAALAAFNLALDFDFIEKGSKQGLPKQMEWVGAVGLLVTLVWLYLEILRLLAKLNSRN